MTIYDIAKEAGVSASTVSRVINGKPGISEKTRKKIHALLEKYNYAPNEAARGLSTSETRMIGILLEDVRNVQHALIAYTIEQALTAAGYAGIIVNTGTTDEKKNDYMRLLAARQIDGAIMVGSTYQNRCMEDLIRTYMPDIPVVMANGWLDLPNVHGVLVDEQKGIEDCVSLLLKKGRRHIVFAMTSSTPSGLNKLAGYRDGLRNSGLADSDMIVEKDCLTAEDGARTADRLLLEHPEADAVIFSEDIPAMGFIRRMAERGVKIPDKISVIGTNNSSFCELSWPRLSSLDNKTVEMCEEAVRIMIALLGGQKLPDRVMLLCDIREREST